MSNMITESIAVKIRKLLSLAKSTNEFEAALAAQRASELMEKYQISHIAEATDEARREGVVEVQRQYPQFAKTCFWALTLAAACARLFDGRTYYFPSTRWGGKFRIVWVGMPSDVDAMQALFDHLYDAYVASCAAAKKDARRTDSFVAASPAAGRQFNLHFGMGFAGGVSNRITGTVRERNTRQQAAANADTAGTPDTPDTSRALVVLKDLKRDSVEQHMAKKKFTSGRGSSVRGAYGSTGYNYGRDAGNKVAITSHRLS